MKWDFHSFSPNVILLTDTCKTSFEAFWMGDWLAGVWSESMCKDCHLNWKELTTVLLAVYQWGHQWKNCIVQVELDNMMAF
jgi:hypothetical protein